MAAATMVSGDARPAVAAISPKPKKKLMAGPMLAIVAAEMSRMPRAPRRRRCSFPMTPFGGLSAPAGGAGFSTVIIGRSFRCF